MSHELDASAIARMMVDALDDMRAEIDRAVSELRKELTQMLYEERAMRQDAVDSVYRVLNARTDHLV